MLVSDKLSCSSICQGDRAAKSWFFVEHCIESLRQGVMCRADTSVFPFHWVDEGRMPMPTWMQRHECVNWDHLTEWLDTREVDVYARGMLTHPKWGQALLWPLISWKFLVMLTCSNNSRPVLPWRSANRGAPWTQVLSTGADFKLEISWELVSLWLVEWLLVKIGAGCNHT